MADRTIPGTVLRNNREYLYISCDVTCDFRKLFKKLTLDIENQKAKEGGAITDRCKITTPENMSFYGVSYKGDIEGWRADFIAQAEKFKLTIAKIDGDFFNTSDGKSYLLLNCAIEFT